MRHFLRLLMWSVAGLLLLLIVSAVAISEKKTPDDIIYSGALLVMGTLDGSLWDYTQINQDRLRSSIPEINRAMRESRWDAAENLLSDAHTRVWQNNIAASELWPVNIHEVVLCLRKGNNRARSIATDMQRTAKFFDESADEKGTLDEESKYANAIGLTALGMVEREEAHLSKAKDYWERALPLFTTLDKQEWISAVLDNLSLLALEQGNISKAEELAAKAMAIEANLNRPNCMASMRKTMCLIAAKQGKPCAEAGESGGLPKLYRVVGLEW